MFYNYIDLFYIFQKNLFYLIKYVKILYKNHFLKMKKFNRFLDILIKNINFLIFNLFSNIIRRIYILVIKIFIF